MSILESAGVLAFAVIGTFVVCYAIHWADMLWMRVRRRRQMNAMLKRHIK